METNPFRAYRGRGTAGDPPAAGGAPNDGAPPSGTPLGRARAWVTERVAGKRWWVRAPLLLIFLWMLRGYLDNPMYRSIFDGVNLGFHEAGHAAFMWFGNRILTVAGGTIFQLGIPLAAGVYLLRKQRDPFGAAVCVFWLGTALVGAGVYAADARAQALPLVSPFGPVDVDSHDWTVMLLKYGMLSRDQAIGAALRGAGLVSMTLSLVGGAWVLRLMATAAPANSHADAFYDAAEVRRLAAFVSEEVGDRMGTPPDAGAASRAPPARRFRSYLDPDDADA